MSYPEEAYEALKVYQMNPKYQLDKKCMDLLVDFRICEFDHKLDCKVEK